MRQPGWKGQKSGGPKNMIPYTNLQIYHGFRKKSIEIRWNIYIDRNVCCNEYRIYMLG